MDAFWHATEYISKALKELYPDKAKREARLQDLKSRLKAGGVAEIIGELEPHRERGEAVGKCIDYFKGNLERMRYDSYRKRGMQIGSGVVESSCRHVVALRLKRPGSPLDAQRGERHAGNQMRAREHALGGLHGLEGRNVAGGLIKLFDLHPGLTLRLTER